MKIVNVQKYGVLPAWQGKFRGKVDLHFHSRFSDGNKIFPLVEMISAARWYDLQVVALTDHDTIAGLGEFLSLARGAAQPVITGVEISTTLEGSGEFHTLAYGFDYNHPQLQAVLADIQSRLVQRFHNLVGWANDNLRAYQLTVKNRIPISRVLAEREQAVSNEEAEAIIRAEVGGTFGRPQLARLLAAKGLIPESLAFRFLKEATRIFPAPTLDLVKATDLVHQADGLVFMSHPLGKERSPRELAEEYKIPALTYIKYLLASNSYDGLEVVHSEQGETETSQLVTLAQAQGLLISGGSDTHWKENDSRIFGISPERALSVQPWMREKVI